MKLADIERDVELFLAAIADRFDCEYGISERDAVEGVLALYRSTGRMNYAQEKAIRAEISARDQKASDEDARRRQEYEKLNPEWAKREKALQEITRINLDHLQRGFLTSLFGYDPYARHEEHKQSVRQWWEKNGVSL